MFLIAAGAALLLYPLNRYWQDDPANVERFPLFVSVDEGYAATLQFAAALNFASNLQVIHNVRDSSRCKPQDGYCNLSVHYQMLLEVGVQVALYLSTLIVPMLASAVGVSWGEAAPSFCTPVIHSHQFTTKTPHHGITHSPSPVNGLMVRAPCRLLYMALAYEGPSKIRSACRLCLNHVKIRCLALRQDSVLQPHDCIHGCTATCS